MLSMVAAAVTLFYLTAIPVHIAFHLHVGADIRFGFGISIFESRFAIKHAFHDKSSIKPPKLQKKLNLPDASATLKTVLQHIKIDRIHLNGIFGTSDAAVTALICGSISGMNCALQCAVGSNAHLNLQPDFSADRLYIDLTGMISLRAGHIMIAALLGAFQYGSRRFKAWTSIPSKAL